MHVDPGYGGFRNFDAEVLTHDDEPDECTVYPADADEDRRTTVWLRAQEGSYLQATAMR